MRNLTLMITALVVGCAGAHRETKQVVDASEYKAKDGTAVSSAGNAAPKGKMVCRMEHFVGSNIPDRVCRYQPAPGELAPPLEGLTSGTSSQGAGPALAQPPVADSPPKPSRGSGS